MVAVPVMCRLNVGLLECTIKHLRDSGVGGVGVEEGLDIYHPVPCSANGDGNRIGDKALHQQIHHPFIFISPLTSSLKEEMY